MTCSYVTGPSGHAVVTSGSCGAHVMSNASVRDLVDDLRWLNIVLLIYLDSATGVRS